MTHFQQVWQMNGPVCSAEMDECSNSTYRSAFFKPGPDWTTTQNWSLTPLDARQVNRDLERFRSNAHIIPII